MRLTIADEAVKFSQFGNAIVARIVSALEKCLANEAKARGWGKVGRYREEHCRGL